MCSCSDSCSWELGGFSIGCSTFNEVCTRLVQYDSALWHCDYLPRHRRTPAWTPPPLAYRSATGLRAASSACYREPVRVGGGGWTWVWRKRFRQLQRGRRTMDFTHGKPGKVHTPRDSPSHFHLQPLLHLNGKLTRGCLPTIPANTPILVSGDSSKQYRKINSYTLITTVLPILRSMQFPHSLLLCRITRALLQQITSPTAFLMERV